MSLRGRLEKLEMRSRFIRRPDPIDPFALARSGELAEADCHYLVVFFRTHGLNCEADQLEADFKSRFEK
jgi:hypothetical protein